MLIAQSFESAPVPPLVSLSPWTYHPAPVFFVPKQQFSRNSAQPKRFPHSCATLGRAHCNLPLFGGAFSSRTWGRGTIGVRRPGDRALQPVAPDSFRHSTWGMSVDTAFFIASKLVGALIRVDTWIVFSFALIALALALNWRRLATITSVISFCLLMVLAIVPMGDLLLRPFESAYPANPALAQVDGIIVLGGGEDVSAASFWRQPQINEGGDRFLGGLALAHRFPEARVMFAGGSGRLRDAGGAQTSEASIAAQIFRSQGLDSDRLLFEDRSRNTSENARLSLSLANPAPDETWVLVTSAFHMPRALRSFEAAGWDGVVPYPVDYRTRSFADGIGWNLIHNIDVLNTGIRETIGSLAYSVASR